MKDVESVTASLSFDDLLSAVNESSRGRWFLDEYQKRLRRTETGDILSAINRIEARIQSMPQAGAAPDEMDRARTAISAARAEIAKLAPAKGLSAEGQLFASLAEMARKVLPAEKTTAELAPGIVKALQLVDELDSTLNGKSKGDAFFRQDQALFEPPPPAPKPVLIALATEPAKPAPDIVPKREPVKSEVETPAQGAKLVIVKTGTTLETDQALAVEVAAAVPAVPPQATPVLESELPSMEVGKPAPMVADKIDSPRIVIIRRKPEEMTEVPLASEAKAETAA